MERRCWLVKTEPGAYSFADLQAEPSGVGRWDGVRNYQTRSFLRQMRRGDRVFVYHSSTEPPHVAGVAEVVREGYPDPAAGDPSSRYHDPKASDGDPRWFAVDLAAVRPLERPVTLAMLEANPALAGMRVVQRGQRLSVVPVTAAELAEIERMGSTALSLGPPGASGA